MRRAFVFCDDDDDALPSSFAMTSLEKRRGISTKYLVEPRETHFEYSTFRHADIIRLRSRPSAAQLGLTNSDNGHVHMR